MTREWTHIVVHCSDLEWGTRDGIDRWHKQRGWAEIGYHFVIENGYPTKRAKYDKQRDGLLVFGRSLGKPGAHARGWNRKGIGICLIGVDDFSARQYGTLLDTVAGLQLRFGIPVDHVLGHYEVSKTKTCPNFDLDLLRIALSGAPLPDY